MEIMQIVSTLTKLYTFMFHSIILIIFSSWAQSNLDYGLFSVSITSNKLTHVRISEMMLLLKINGHYIAWGGNFYNVYIYMGYDLPSLTSILPAWSSTSMMHHAEITYYI